MGVEGTGVRKVRKAQYLPRERKQAIQHHSQW